MPLQCWACFAYRSPPNLLSRFGRSPMLARTNHRFSVLALALVTLAISSAARAADAPLVVGDEYTIVSTRKGVQQQYQGTLVKLNQNWLVLHADEDGGRRSWFGFSKVVLANHTDDEDHGMHTGRYVWIPREAVSVKRHRAGNKLEHHDPPREEAPPAHVACAVQLNRRGKLVSLKGGMEEVQPTHFVVAVLRKVEKTNREGMGL